MKNIFSATITVVILTGSSAFALTGVYNCNIKREQTDVQKEACALALAAPNRAHRIDYIEYSQVKPFMVGGVDETCGVGRPLGSEDCN